MLITDFIENQIASLSFIPSECVKILKHYLDRLIRGHKKNVRCNIRELDPWFNTKFFLKNLHKLKNYSKRIKNHLFQQILNKVDRRSRFINPGDDTTHRVYGKKIHAANIQHDHGINGSINPIKIVDMVVVDLKDRILINDFDTYLPKKFVKKYPIKGYRFRSKIQILLKMILDIIKRLILVEVPKKRIWAVMDIWFSSSKFEKCIRDIGISYALQSKKDRQVRLFKNWININDY